MGEKRKIIKISEATNFKINTAELERVRESFVASLEPLMETIQNGINLQAAKIFEEFSEKLEQIKKQYEELPEYIKFFSRHGWIVYGKLTPYEVKKYAQFFTENDFTFEEEEKQLSEFYIENISKKERLDVIDQIMKRDILKDRKLLLQEVRFACEKEKYFLGSIALVSIIEGLLITQMNSKKRVYQKDIIEYTKKRTEKSMIDNASLNYVIAEVFYKDFVVGKEVQIPNDICRHAIMHGIDIGCGTEGVCLKLLLILNATSRVLSKT